MTDAKPMVRHSLWIGIGVLMAIFIMWTQAGAVDGWTGLLTVGEDSMLRPFVERQIPKVSIVEGEGNDGQIFYAIGADLAGEQAPDLINHPGLRYRRILYPALASLFGVLEGQALFWSMVSLSVFSIGVATATLADIATTLEMPRWVMFGLLANPGVWLALHMVIPDPLAIALALLAVALALRGHHGWAIATLCLVGLTKDPFLLFGIGLAGWMWFEKKRLEALAYAFLPVVPLSIWMIIVSSRLGGGGSTLGVALVPFAGIVEAADFWSQVPTREFVGTIVTFVVIALGVLVGLMRSSALVKWMVWPWILLLLIGSVDIWRYGLGTLRIAAPIGILAGLGAVQILDSRDAKRRG